MTLKWLSYRHAGLRSNIELVAFITRRYAQQAASPLPIPPKITALTTPEDRKEARSWISSFRTCSIPRELVELNFSKSSGPGGQHVNKVNTKATLRCSIDSHWIPTWAISNLKTNPHYVSSTNSILITSTVHRSQAQNIENCLSKLHDLVLMAASNSIQNEPSEEQKKRVAAFERAEKVQRRQEKSYRSQIKKGRAKSSGLD